VLDKAEHYFLHYRAADLAEVLTQVHPVVRVGDGARLARGPRGPRAAWWLHDSISAPDESPGNGRHGLRRFLKALRTYLPGQP